MRSIRLPHRSRRFGVGKEIGGAIYVHRRYEGLLGSVVESARARIPADFAYTVVKVAWRTGTVTFVSSPDFDTTHEPVAGDHWTVPQTGPARFRAQAADPYIYHHKWLMVADDYAGFDVEASKARSRWWLALPGVDKSRIGRRGYWERQVDSPVSRVERGRSWREG